MEKEDGNFSQGRAELIRQARASCSQKLDGAPSKVRTVSPKVENSEVKEFPRLKFFVIRLITAIIMFLAIVTIDQLKIENGYVDRNTIKEQISSNVRVEQLEKYISEFTEEKILPVFNK